MTGDFHTATLNTVLAGGRLLAVAQDLDPDTLESIIRKAARMSGTVRFAMMRQLRANDPD